MQAIWWAFPGFFGGVLVQVGRAAKSAIWWLGRQDSSFEIQGQCTLRREIRTDQRDASMSQMCQGRPSGTTSIHGRLRSSEPRLGFLYLGLQNRIALDVDQILPARRLVTSKTVLPIVRLGDRGGIGHPRQIEAERTSRSYHRAISATSLTPCWIASVTPDSDML